MEKLAPYAKAIMALLGTAFGLYMAAKGADTPAGVGITSDEWITIIITSLLTGGVVWGVPNAAQMIPTKELTVKTERTLAEHRAEVAP